MDVEKSVFDSSSMMTRKLDLSSPFIFIRFTHREDERSDIFGQAPLMVVEINGYLLADAFFLCLSLRTAETLSTEISNGLL